MFAVTLTDISTALHAHAASIAAESTAIYRPWGQHAGKAPVILAVGTVLPGKRVAEERGGPEALSRREGVFRVQCSVSADRPLVPALELASMFEDGLRKQIIRAGGGCVVFDEVWAEGPNPDPTGRQVVTVTAPWHVFS